MRNYFFCLKFEMSKKTHEQVFDFDIKRDCGNLESPKSCHKLLLESRIL